MKLPFVTENTKKDEDLIGWLCSKTYILGHIQMLQGNEASAVIRACLTQWLGHFCAH